MSSGIDYLNLQEIVKTCLNKLGFTFPEAWITPIRNGYRVELQPPQSRELLNNLALCIKESLKVEVLVKDYVHGSAILVKA
jgi:hypothetical protein